MHEIASYIQVHDITRTLPVLAFLATEIRYTAYAIMSATILDAGISILNKSPLVQTMSIVEVQMMYYAVSEHCSEDFPFLRIVHNEAFRW